MRDKVNIVLDSIVLGNYAIKKKLEDAAGVYRFDLAAKNNFIAVKFEGEKLDIKRLGNGLTSLNN